MSRMNGKKTHNTHIPGFIELYYVHTFILLYSIRQSLSFWSLLFVQNLGSISRYKIQNITVADIGRA